MSTVFSADSTAIAYDTIGQGPAVILVDGALCHRTSGPAGPLAERLAERFTVYTYDRRGRGESGDTQPYGVDREVEDLAAVIGAAGGSAMLYGISSGAVLALHAASRVADVEAIALYEPPFIVDDSRAPIREDYRRELETLIAEHRRADAVRLFMGQVGVPRPFIALMRFLPAWSKLKAVAHTLPYDAQVMGDTQGGAPLPAERWNVAAMPALVLTGGKSPDWMRAGGEQLATVLPDARHAVLPGQTHMVSPKALAPVLTDFFESATTAPRRSAAPA